MPVILSLAGCGAKPEDVVKLYIKRMGAYDVVGAKKLCAGVSRDDLTNLQENYDVQRVMAAGADVPPEQEHPTQVETILKIDVEQSSKTIATVIVTTENEQVIFNLTKINGKWVIGSVSDPFIWLPNKGKI
jgi:hypothetical protein